MVNMKIAIAGYGLEGESNYRYWSSDLNNSITIVDQRQPDSAIPSGVETIIGEDAFDKLQNFDIVVRTAGLAPRKIKTNGKIWSSTNEFFEKCPAQIIGVTGTKGKGTTCSLIASILEAAGKNVWLVGNIGNPPLDILENIGRDDYVVYELSSFQLWDLSKSPHIAVILFIEQEHMDVHESFGEYVSAKENITRFQSPDDTLVYNCSNKHSSEIASRSKAVLVGYPDINSAHVKDEYFCYGEQTICSVGSLGILGKFNYDNACAAIDAIWGITDDSGVIERGLSSFKGLPHRLQFVREFNGAKYYDDSIATIPGAAVAALRAFDGQKVIILGGSSKGSDFSELGKELARQDARAVIIGAEADKIVDACQAAGFDDYTVVNEPDMNKIVTAAAGLATRGGVVLLSPACASFGLFKNYSDRGEQFIAAVNKL